MSCRLAGYDRHDPFLLERKQKKHTKKKKLKAEKTNRKRKKVKKDRTTYIQAVQNNSSRAVVPSCLPAWDVADASLGKNQLKNSIIK